ncbi:hypothetical protein LB505_013433 [Fusarium chuoi]|nr:hypothetical protein LB505_013433 [Fusarium chuoi]
MPFERTSFPGLTVIGVVESDGQLISLDSREGWVAQEDNSILFPTGRPDDVFLHTKSHPCHTTSRHLTESFHHGVFDLA